MSQRPNPYEICLQPPTSPIQSGENVEFETGANSGPPSALLRAADQEPPRALRRREGFRHMNGARIERGS